MNKKKLTPLLFLKISFSFFVILILQIFMLVILIFASPYIYLKNVNGLNQVKNEFKNGFLLLVFLKKLKEINIK